MGARRYSVALRSNTFARSEDGASLKPMNVRTETHQGSPKNSMGGRTKGDGPASSSRRNMDVSLQLS